MKRARDFLSTSVVERERSHRLAVLFGLIMLLVLAASPLLARHLPIGLDQQLAGRDHLWMLCLAAIHLLLAPVHGIFHLLFLGGVTYAVVDRWIALRSQRSVLNQLTVREPVQGSAMVLAARAARVDPALLNVVDGLPSPAFTTGWIRPRIYLSSCLAERLSRPELEAVIAHEAAHVRRRDPLRLSVLRFVACMLFWLPAVRQLTEDLADEAEVRADDAAARDRPLALATALVQLAQWLRPAPVTHGGVGFDERDLLERRVRRLTGEAVEPRSRITRRSLLTAVLVLALAGTSGAVVAHPLTSESAAHEEHCEHSGSGALFHLFCAGHSPAARAVCLHR
ncbi:MAG: M56 family metallopeptidase [Gemmatimonadetes bacterium]|nr:M56 family metallopeptidase [Gemmatimonadota bacterium]